MKKLVTLAFATIAAGATFAAANDLLITFSTLGPDKYADGTTVLDGERYALCWSEDFSQFAIKPDGTAEGGNVVLKARVAKGGRCPTTVFEVDAAKAPTGGEWAVYLLDTRVFAADGTASIPPSLKAVNTVGLVGASVQVGAGAPGDLVAGVAAATTDLPAGADVPAPVITGIRIFEGDVYVSVKGTVPYLAYGLAEGISPDAVTDSVGEPQAGKVSVDDEITIITPVKEGGAFFKVNQK